MNDQRSASLVNKIKRKFYEWTHLEDKGRISRAMERIDRACREIEADAQKLKVDGHD